MATKLRDLLQRPNPQPSLAVDADLRPEGKNGAAREVLRIDDRVLPAVVGSVGDPGAAEGAPGGGARGSAATGVAEAIDKERYRAEVTADALKQMRTLKARMEAERLPRGIDPRRHLKLGPGGLSDVEWTVQLLQLRHGHAVAGPADHAHARGDRRRTAGGGA